MNVPECQATCRQVVHPAVSGSCTRSCAPGNTAAGPQGHAGTWPLTAALAPQLVAATPQSLSGMGHKLRCSLIVVTLGAHPKHPQGVGLK